MSKSLFAYLLVPFLLLFSVSNRIFAQTADVAKLAAEADLKYSTFQMADALVLYRQLDSISPNTPEYIYKIGMCNYELDYRRAALPYFERVAEMKPDIDKTFYRYLGRCYHIGYRFDEAIKSFEKYKEVIKGDLEETKKANKYIEECNYAKQYITNPKVAKISNMGPVINSKYDDYAPVISADEQMLIFTSRREGSVGGKLSKYDNAYFEDIYVSTNSDTGWTQPVNMGPPINTDKHDACIGLSPDGHKMFIYRSHKRTNGDIFVTENRTGVWAEPVMLDKQINSNHYEPSAGMTSHERSIFFSSNKPTGMGGLDIYVSHLLPNGMWNNPTNLGDVINTEYSEDAPFISHDNKTLYFSSNGHGSMGGYDIFMSTYNVEDSTWSKPENLGFPVNTPDDDIYLGWSQDGLRGYFSTYREDSYGGKDIYMLEMPENPLSLIVLKGKVTIKGTEIPVSSLIKITELDDQSGTVVGVANSNRFNGSYMSILPHNKKYNLTVEAEGYMYYSDNFELPETYEFLEVERNIQLEPIMEGTSIVLKNIFFDYDKYDLRTESYKELNNVVDFMNAYPELIVEISGHTDSIGGNWYNNVLSENRAHSVSAYLIEKGVDTTRIVTKGYGETKPIADNGTPEGRQENRRTEFMIVSKSRLLDGVEGHKGSINRNVGH